MNPQSSQDPGQQDQLHTDVPTNLPAVAAPVDAPPLPMSVDQPAAAPTPVTSTTAVSDPPTSLTTDEGSDVDLSDLIAADNDVIERQWIDRIRAAVAETKDNPYAQVQAIEKIRAEYMKKRYNKELKQDQSS